MKNILTRLLLAFTLICSASADFNPGPFKIWDGTDALEIDASGRITVLQGGSWSFSLGASIPAGSSIIGKVAIDQTTPGTTNFVVNNQTQINGVAVSAGNGTTDTGTQRVSISSDSTGLVKLATGANTIGALTANQSVNIAQMNGVTTSIGTGASDTGTQRVVLANENVQDVAVTGFSETAVASQWNLLASTQTTSATDAIGYRSMAVQVEGIGVSSVTATFEGSNDNISFVSIPMYDRSSPITAPSAAPSLSGSPMHKFFDGPVTFRYIRYRMSAITATSVQCFTKFSTVQFYPSTTQVASSTGTNTNVNISSGTVTTVSTLSATTSLTPGTAAANLGKAEDAVSASGDTGVFMLGIRRDTLLSATSGTGDYQELAANKYGATYVASYEKQMPTFSAVSSITAAASATDIAILPGNATNTVYVTRVTISGIQTTGGMVDVSLVKRSAANSGGTSGAMTSVPNNTANSAAASLPLAYTANPTPGATVGTVARSYVPVPAIATATVNGITTFDFGERGQPIILSGIAQNLAVNLNGVTVTGGVFSVKYEWFEAP